MASLRMFERAGRRPMRTMVSPATTKSEAPPAASTSAAPKGELSPSRPIRGSFDAVDEKPEMRPTVPMAEIAGRIEYTRDVGADDRTDLLLQHHVHTVLQQDALAAEVARLRGQASARGRDHGELALDLSC